MVAIDIERGMFAERIESQLGRMDLAPGVACKAAGLLSGFLRGWPSRYAARAILDTSVSYLMGLDPDMPSTLNRKATGLTR